MAEKTENTYHYLWFKRKQETTWDYYYYSPGITKTKAQEIVKQDSTITDYELTNSSDSMGWAIS